MIQIVLLIVTLIGVVEVANFCWDDTGDSRTLFRGRVGFGCAFIGAAGLLAHAAGVL